MSPGKWLTVTCLILAVPAGLRLWREWKFSRLAAQSEACPFPLSQLPPSMGRWRADAGTDLQLDPDVARFAGASEHVVRNFVDAQSGDQALALILYGLGTTVYLHVPEVCYPAAGYALFNGPIDHTISVKGMKEPVHYRWAIYTKRVDGVTRFEESYYTFEHGGIWKPDLSDRWKRFRYDPGVFKVQICRPISSLRDDADPAGEALLAELVKEINDRFPATEKPKG